ncbi:MAG TPA: hypothetical protein VG929_02685 [Actinomycetota bacterium]|nr:hypothetical protein [Actinomycetota bacterium]
MKRLWGALAQVVAAVVVIAAVPAAHASHADNAYDLPLWFRWDRAVLDVLIVPPNHGQIYNGNGVLNGGDPDELTPFNSYLAAIEDSIADWDKAVEMFGAEWLRTNLQTNVYVVGRDAIPAQALTQPEIIVTTDETKGHILGVAISTRPCIVDNSKLFVTSFTYEDMYNVNAQEYGHCLGLEHVVDNHPETDAMAGRYVHSPGAKGNALHCVSNLDVRGLESVFGRLFGRPSPDVVSMPVAEYATTCSQRQAVPTDPSPSPTPSSVPGGGSPSPSPTPSSEGSPAPAPSSEPEPTPSSSPTPTAAPSSEPEPTPSSSATPSATPSPSSTPTPAPSSSEPTPDPTPSSTPSPTPTAQQTPSSYDTGAEVHDRAVRLRLRRHLVAVGSVVALDDSGECYSSVRVEISKRKHGRWTMVTAVRTATDGTYRVRIADRRGKYRALVRRFTSGTETCGHAVSATRRHRH